MYKYYNDKGEYLIGYKDGKEISKKHIATDIYAATKTIIRRGIKENKENAVNRLICMDNEEIDGVDKYNDILIRLYENYCKPPIPVSLLEDIDRLIKSVIKNKKEIK